MNDRNIKLYCGGRFYFNCKVEGYLDQVANDYRAILLGDVSKLLHPKATYMINEHTEYSPERTDPCPDYYGMFRLLFENNPVNVGGEMDIDQLDMTLFILNEFEENR